MVVYTITVCGCLCELNKFKINEINADDEDFGEKYDAKPDKAEPYGCGDMRFFPKPPTDEILEKYGITVDEYNKITEELEKELSFGCCGWCV